MSTGTAQTDSNQRLLFMTQSTYSVLGVILLVIVLWGAELGKVVPLGLLLGGLAWIAASQGMVLFQSWVLSLELAVYLWAFLCMGYRIAFMSVAVCSLLTIVFGTDMRQETRKIRFIVRKLSNIFVLGLSLSFAVLTYGAAGGRLPLSYLDDSAILALLVFWISFAVVNNLLFLPHDYLRRGSGFITFFLKESFVDGGLHLIAMLAGSGFALLYNRHQRGALFLLIPLFMLLAFALKRLSDRSRSLKNNLVLMKKLNPISAHLHASLRLDDVLDTVEVLCQELFGVQNFVVGLIDDRASKIRFARVVENGKRIEQEAMDIDRGLTGLVVSKGQPIFTEDLQNDGDLKAYFVPAGDPDLHIRSIMMAPLFDKNRIIGVFSMQSHHARAFRPFHRELFLSVTQQVAAAVVSARLYRRATEDNLTNLYNKSYFEERLSESLTEGHPFGLLFLDCDGFKVINDRYGHLVGDRYLQELGTCIQRQCRGTDIPCRYGGDEFAILVLGATRRQTHNIAERIRTQVNALSVRVEQEMVRTTASIGTLWSDGRSKELPVEDVLRKVDTALYSAKKTTNAVKSIEL